MSDAAADIKTVVHHLKSESDTWRIVAEKYRDAFMSQTARLQELQDICVATQAELENERTVRSFRTVSSDVSLRAEAIHTGHAKDDTQGSDYGTAKISSGALGDLPWVPAQGVFDPCFRRVEKLAGQRDYGTALEEMDRLLCSHLHPKVRIEGLLLKSNLMRKSEWLYDALAACSEALELCHRLNELHVYLDQIHYQRGICYYQLGLNQQALDAFGEVCTGNDVLSVDANALRISCEEQIHAEGRSGFEACRTVAEMFLPAHSDRRSKVGNM